MARFSSILILGLAPFSLLAQQSPDIQRILDRLDKLEQENQALTTKVKQLEDELAAARPAPAQPPAADGDPQAPAQPQPQSASQSVEDKLAIQQSRIEEQAQTKVEASQKYPISITGMALFNSFLNSQQNSADEYPTAAALNPRPDFDGATLRQTIIGLEYHGPQTFLGGTVHGSLYMDFFTGGLNFNSMFRLRTGSIYLSWKTRSIMVGIDKPIFNPRDPSSLAQVGISPLTGAGNLWLWIPQARVEQDVAFNASTGLHLITGVVETHETSPYGGSAPQVNVEPNRPGIEGRYEFYHDFAEDRRIELAAGFHESRTHAGGFSIPSQVVSFDWLLRFNKRADVTGVFFTGQNVANLGTGAINNGYYVYGNYAAAIAARGGWSQLAIHAARRLDFHLFGGFQYYESQALRDPEDATRNAQYGINLFYHVAPNVIIGPEISQIRTLYVMNGTRLLNHYDLALAYLF